MPIDYSGKKIEMYVFIGVACIAVFVFIVADFVMGADGPLFELWREIGAVNFYIMGITVLAAIYFIYYAFKMWRLRDEFHELMETGSKAMFLRSLDRIEYLAWKLGEESHQAVQDKREGFKIKRRK